MRLPLATANLDPGWLRAPAQILPPKPSLPPSYSPSSSPNPPPNPTDRVPLRQILLALLLEMLTPAELRKPKKLVDAAVAARARTCLGRGGGTMVPPPSLSRGGGSVAPHPSLGRGGGILNLAAAALGYGGAPNSVTGALGRGGGSAALPSFLGCGGGSATPWCFPDSAPSWMDSFAWQDRENVDPSSPGSWYAS